LTYGCENVILSMWLDYVKSIMKRGEKMKVKILINDFIEDTPVGSLVEAKYFKDMSSEEKVKWANVLKGEEESQTLWDDNDIFAKNSKGEWLWMYEDDIDIVVD